ncbi:MAG: hypothetical protein WBM24_02240 [Candidatus Sulfotelmatobacter sp.]
MGIAFTGASHGGVCYCDAPEVFSARFARELVVAYALRRSSGRSLTRVKYAAFRDDGSHEENKSR